MALILMDGFEGAPVLRNQAVVSGSLGSFTGRDGIGRAVAGSSGENFTYPLPTNPTTVIIGLGVYPTAYSGTNHVINLQGDVTSTSHMCFNFDALGRITLRRGGGAGTILATSVEQVPLNAWSWIEFKCTLSDTVGVGIIKLNGVTVINFAGDTKNAGTGVTFTSLAMNIHTLHKFDDLYVLDDTGPAPYNNFMGERVIRPVRPSGAGASAGLTPSAGANWSCMDDSPWATALTDYVSGTSGFDTYACSDVSGLVSVDAVQVAGQAAKTDLGPRNVRLLAYNGTTTESPDRPLTTTLLPYQSDILMTDPSGAPWTQASVNSAEFGVKVT